MESIDRKIIESIKNGQDDKALSYLYDHTLRKVRRYIIKNKGSREEANDIFQDAVVIFFRKVKQDLFNSSYEVDAFIFTVARNLWIDKIRREKRMITKDFTLEHDHSDYQDHLKDLIDLEKLNAMKTAMEKLDEKCRNILRYVLYEKLSMKKISELMGYSSENVAKTNHYRCKQYLSKIILEDKELLNLLKN